jgi:two-component system, chemotaxis family, chemotaxis protein CheY
MALKILIADDSATVRAVIAKALAIAGIPVGEVMEASNGQEALDILGKNWVDLVFTDLNMPVMGGMEMIAKMAESDLLKTVPVVVISTEGSASRVEELKAKGISAYLRKPFTPEMLREVVNNTLGEKSDG